MLASQFKKTVAKVIQQPLRTLGYRIDQNPPAYGEQGHIWFEKQLQAGVCIIIDFQPSEIAPNHFNRFAINLTRNSTLCKYKNIEIVPGYFLRDRLAPALWIKDRHNPSWDADQWWHFRDIGELEIACQAALSQLIEYGIPYLEDLNSKSLIMEEGKHS